MLPPIEIIRLKQNSREWLDFRKNGIGGSEAAAAIGKSKWQSNIEFWEIKTSLQGKDFVCEPSDISENEAIKYGRQAEEDLIKLFALDYPKYEVLDAKEIVYKRGFMFGSLDARLIEKSSGRHGFLECKTAHINSRLAADSWNGRIPEQYYIQILHYFIVTGFTFCMLKARLVDTDRNGEIAVTETHRHYERKDLLADMQYLYNEEKRAWGYIETKTRPPAILREI